MMKKLGSITVAVSMFAGSIAPQVGAIVSAAAVPAVVTAAGAATLLAPGTAQAQKNSRVCAQRFGNSYGNVWMYLEVDKPDVFTCGAIHVAFEAAFGAFKLKDFGDLALKYAVFGPVQYNVTCENFSKKIRWYNTDICNQTTRYKVYAVAGPSGQSNSHQIKRLT